jgi:hypothetical protein
VNTPVKHNIVSYKTNKKNYRFFARFDVKKNFNKSQVPTLNNFAYFVVNLQCFIFLCTALLVGRSRDRFPVVAIDGTMCPGVDSASKNEYQGFPLGVKAADA